MGNRRGLMVANRFGEWKCTVCGVAGPTSHVQHLGDCKISLRKGINPTLFAPTRIGRLPKLQRLSVAPERCGIYFLIHRDEVVYVGQSVNVLARVMQHVREGIKKFDAVFYLDVSVAALSAVEYAFIQYLTPKYNGVCPRANRDAMRLLVEALPGRFPPAERARHIAMAMKHPQLVDATAAHWIEMVQMSDEDLAEPPSDWEPTVEATKP